VLSVGDDDGGGQQRADGRARIAADLESRLRRPEAAARSHPCNSRSFRVEGRRPDTHHSGRHQEHLVAAGKGEQRDADEGHHHARGQQVWLGVLVGVHADPWLQQRGRDLVDQRDPADLREAQRKLGFQHRVHGGQYGLDEVVQQVRKGGGTHHRQEKRMGLVGR